MFAMRQNFLRYLDGGDEYLTTRYAFILITDRLLCHNKNAHI
jgi:hypothetical protein